MSLRSWIGNFAVDLIVKATSTFRNPSRPWLDFFGGGDTWAGKSVHVDSALQVATFWACVRLLSQTIGTLPFGLYQKTQAGGRDPLPKHPLYVVLHDQPNADQTAAEFWEGITASLCIWGNGYAEKITSSAGIVGLKPLPAQCVTVFRNDAGALRYRVSDRGKTTEFPEEKIFHVRGFGLGGDVGLSPLGFARQTLGAAMAADEAAARTFANGMRPGGFLMYDKTLTQEQRDQAKKTLIDPFVGAENAAKIGILEAGFKWQDVMMKPEDAQLLQTRSFQIEELCRWLGVPPILVGHSSAGMTAWGSGIEQIILGWLQLGLRPYLTRIEQAVKRALITPADRSKGIYAELNFEGLLRADSAGRAALYSTFAQNGIMSRNEIRSRENLPRMDGGDMLTVQVNLTPINQLGKQDAGAQAARTAFMNWLQPETAEPGQRPKLEVVK